MSSQHRSSNVDIAPEGHLSRTKRRQFRQRNAAVKWIRNPPIEGRNWQGGETEWNKSKKPYRNNGSLSRTNLNATQTVHSTTLSVYTSTHPGVRIPPSVWHDSWLPSPPLKTASLDWKSVLLGRASARQKGVEERGVGFSDAAGASSSSSLSPRRITPSLSYCSQYSLSSQNSTVPPLCCPQAKVCGSFFHPIRKPLMGMLPIQPSV